MVVVVASGVVPDGVTHAATVPELAVRTWPVVGAVAADTETTVVALRSPDAVLSSLSLASLPCVIVPAEVPYPGVARLNVDPVAPPVSSPDVLIVTDEVAGVCHVQ